jgi:HK97 family phage major capsid protein
VEERDAELQAKVADAQGSAGARGQGSSEEKTFGPVYAMRYGDESELKQVVMRDLVGPDYRQMIDRQNQAFAKYLRNGDLGLEREEIKLLRTQVFPWEQVEQMVKDGVSISQIKTTMVEAQGSLGGYAVPPNVQAAIISRLPGMTVVRGSGARVVELTSGNAIDVPSYTGGDARYRGALRGLWGTETQAPTEDNATFGQTTVVANVYTYKVSFSQSLVEDAGNLVQLVQSDIADTLAIDEDEAFLIGDGVGKPMGLLPGSANPLSLSTVNSGSGTALTADGLIGLSDGLDVQYMQNAVMVMKKATGTAIRKLKTGDGEYLFDRNLENNKRTLLGYPYKMSEAMPAVAGSAFPILFGDFSGYWIVQKAGLTIARFQDSNTGINKVEYHVRRRVGGRVVETWRFVAQYVSA